MKVMKLSSATFTKDFELGAHEEHRAMRVEDKLDAETREKLERLRRGQGP
jgi:hypothetical protein